jgi:predicted LPLAT superfamily acyltransferase
MKASWKSSKERSNTFTLRLICWIALNTSRWLARLWLYPITLYFFITSPDVRIASKHYLRRVKLKPTNFCVAKHIFYFSTTILDRVFFLTDRFYQFDIRVYNRELISENLKNKRGCILLGTHLGSFEVLRSLLIKRGEFPLKILMNYDHNAKITRVLDTLNPKVASTVINLNDENVIFKIAESIEQGEIVAMLGDRPVDSASSSSHCNLLGDLAEFSNGPVKLALALEVPIVMFFGIYKGGNRYEIHFEELMQAKSIKRSEREMVVEETIIKFARIFEKYIQMAPLNWFNFYDYWNDEK